MATDTLHWQFGKRACSSTVLHHVKSSTQNLDDIYKRAKRETKTQKRIPQLWKSINAPPHIFDGNSIFIQDLDMEVNYTEAQKTTN